MLKYITLLNEYKLINIFFSSYYFFKLIRFFLINLYNSFKFFKINIYLFRYFTYTGKIFRLKFLKRKIKFFFNRRHRTFLYFNNYIFTKKIGKKKFKLLFVLINDFFMFKGFYKKIRPLNIFTWRGITLWNSFLNKKQGKISSYKRGISY